MVDDSEDPKKGSLNYLMIKSHSVSRAVFQEKVAAELETKIDTILKKKSPK